MTDHQRNCTGQTVSPFDRSVDRTKLTPPCIDGKIVGVRYYTGYASPGEAVLCHREPENQACDSCVMRWDLADLDQYDSNAIRVDSVMHSQIGHLPRKVAEKIAPYMVVTSCTFDVPPHNV